MLACVFYFLGQDVVFKCLGENILQNAFEGYNACIFAYGQTGESQSQGEMFPPKVLCSGSFHSSRDIVGGEIPSNVDKKCFPLL